MLALLTLLWANAVLAQGTGRAGPPHLHPWAPNLGAAGLLAEFGSYDTYGTVQERLGQSRAQIAWAAIPGNPTSGYEDAADVLVVPVDLAVPLGSEHSFLRVGGVAMYNRGRENITWVDIDTRRAELQYLYIPTPDTILAIGGTVENADIAMGHSPGHIASDGLGLRADIVHKFSPRWGIAVRGELIAAEAETRLTLRNALRYGYDQDYRRLYLQTCLVGTFTHDSLRWVPQGWVFRPNFTALFERNSFADALDTFGRTVRGTVGSSDSYATLSACGRLERASFRPWHPAPFLEVGLEHEIRNDLDALLDEPTILRTAIGASLNLTHGARIDVEYSRHDGLEGLRRDQSLTVHLGFLF